VRTWRSVRSRIRIEDLLAASIVLILLLFFGVRTALSSIRLDEENFWDFSFILAPVALLVLGASLRYALGTSVGGLGQVAVDVGRVIRDWFPFLLFLLAYEAFQSRLWSIVAYRNFDVELLRWDRRLFGESPTFLLQRWIQPGLTDLLTIAYFLHLILPPVVGLVWYQKDRRVFREFLLAIVLAGALGFLGYLAVPAVGPGVAFPSLFQRELGGALYRPVTAFLDIARSPRDAFPSLHVGISTIVLYYGGRRSRIWLAVLVPLVVANWFSTIYLRYHYLIDVIAGWLVAAVAIV